MKRCGQALVWAVLALLLGLSLAADWAAPAGYATQFREHPNEPPSAQFWLGTDALGRDRWARLLHGARVSFLLAPAAALVTTWLAALVGLAAGLAGPRAERVILSSTDLASSLPWIFLLLSARACLPLNVSSWTSAVITFGLLALLGWTASARIVRAAVRAVAPSGFLLQARALGLPPWRICRTHLFPHLGPVLAAQFWIAVPLFLLSEANLGLLGLGVTEPLPSLGSLLLELVEARGLWETPGAWLARPWLWTPALWLIAPLLALEWLRRQHSFREAT
jgi:ABC-type dipeptide/oligopeptide/nickel transport system permease subunit